MPDIRTTQTNTFPFVAIELDWLLSPIGTLADDYSLASAVYIALCTDRLADATDVLPDLRSNDRRGWWADYQAQQVRGGWPIGSRLWLLSRAKITDLAAKQGATVNNVRVYINECLQPFVQNRILSNFGMNVYQSPRNRQRINVNPLVLYRSAKQPPINLSYQVLWDELGLSITPLPAGED